MVRPTCKNCGKELSPVATARGIKIKITRLTRFTAGQTPDSWYNRELKKKQEELREILRPDYVQKYGYDGQGHFHSGKCAEAFGVLAAAAGIKKLSLREMIRRKEQGTI